MKILVVHNTYQQHGGEDVVVRMESELLERNGNLAGKHMVTNDRITGFAAKLGAALGVVFSVPGYRAIRKRIQETAPDVVHVHNFFPLISPSVFYACRAEGVPVVLTLHNYRIVCPTALLMHDGAVTERSLTEGPWWALRHRVYRGSLVGTFLLCLMIWLHKRVGTWRNKVDRFIVLSEFGRGRFVAAGLPAHRLVVKPNFVDLPAPVSRTRHGLLFVGRLSVEKGIDTLVQAAARLATDAPAQGAEIRIAGDGPLAGAVAQTGLKSLGALQAADVRNEMQTAVALLMPSISYEGFPMVLVEAYANGLPVIVSRIGALAELVEDGVTGLLFEPGDAAQMAERMRWAMDHPDEMQRMGRNARQRYDALYTPKRNHEQLMAIYRDAIAEHAAGRKQA